MQINDKLYFEIVMEAFRHLSTMTVLEEEMDSAGDDIDYAEVKHKEIVKEISNHDQTIKTLLSSWEQFRSSLLSA